MIKEAIASFEKNRNTGYTLIELIVVMGILSILSMLTIPPMITYVEAAKRQVCVAEAEMVGNAVNSYIIRRNISEHLLAWDLYEEILFHPIDSKENPLSDMLTIRSSDGRLVSIMYSERKRLYNGIIYEAGGYKITIIPGEDTKVVKIK